MIQAFLQLPVVALVRVLLGIVLAFVILPAIVLPRPTSVRTSLDAAVVRSVRWIGIILVVSHLLVVVRLFHVAPILLLCAWAWARKRGALPSTSELQTRRQRRKAAKGSVGGGRVSFGQNLWLQFTDVMHRFESSGSSVVGDWFRRMRAKVSGWIRAMFTRRTATIAVLISPVVGILGVSLAMRVELAFRFETLSPPEAYVYLTWAKNFAANAVFVDGLYPHGLPAFVAFLGKMTPGVDLYEIIRYTGPLIGMLLVFGIFYAVLRLSANVGAALFGAGAFGLFGTVQQWHSPWIRQTGPLPQELGFAIALLALPSAVLAITERDRDHIRTMLLASIGIGIIHPVPLVFFLVLAVIGALGSSVYERGGLRHLGGVLGFGLLGGAIAHLYLPIGLLLGQPIFRGMDHPFTGSPVEFDREAQLMGMIGTELIEHNELSYAAGIGAALALVAAIVLHRRPRTSHIGAQLAGLGCIGLAAVALYDPRWMPLPLNLLGPLASLAGVALALALAAGFAAITSPAFAVDNPWGRGATVIVLAAVAVAGFGTVFETSPRQRAPSEYEAMASVTRDIMRNQDAFTYTIVGTPQQRQAVAGIGTFIELWVFARDVTVRDAQDPGFVVPDVSSLMFARDLGQNLPIPTADIYIFIEKEPFPVPEAPPVGPTEEFYYNREKRGRIMATVFAWAEFYRYYHTDMEVHFEDEEVIVYRIQRRPNPVAAAAAPQFKDYTWEPGVLFTGGPAEPGEVEIPWHD